MYVHVCSKFIKSAKKNPIILHMIYSLHTLLHTLSHATYIPGRQVLVVVKYLLTQLVDKLIKAKIDLCLNLVVEELPLEVVQGVACTVTVEVQRVEDVLHHVGLLVLQDVVGQDPRQGHLNGELDALAHGQLQVELTEPQLRQVTALS